MTPSDLPKELPIFPLGGVLLLPRSDLPLNIFEPRYLAMVTDALKGARMIGMVQPDTPEGLKAERDPMAAPTVYGVGCAGRITSFAETPDGRILIVLTGICRFRIRREIEPRTTPYRIVEPDYESFLGDLDEGPTSINLDRSELQRSFDELLGHHNMQLDWSEIGEATDEDLINVLAMMSPYSPQEKQALLEAPDLAARAEVLSALTDIALAEMKGQTRRLLN
jgi:Lon protease-like protein